MRVDHHTDRDEKHGTKQILDWGGDLMNCLYLKRFRQDRAHDERAQSRGIARDVCQNDHQETQADRKNRQRLLRHEFARPAQHGRHQENTAKKPYQQEENQLQHTGYQFHTVKRLADRQCGKNDQKQHCLQVLHHQLADDIAAELLAMQLHVVEGFSDNRRGRNGKHRAEEDAVHLRPAQGLSEHESHHAHRHQLSEGRHADRPSHFLQLLETELQADAKQHEHHADFAPGLHARVVLDDRKPLEVGPDEESSDDIAQHNGLFQPLENDGSKTRRDQNQGEVGE